MVETHLTGRQTELRSLGLVEGRDPGGQLLVGQRCLQRRLVDPLRQVRERAPVGGHDVGRLHPGDVIERLSAVAAEFEVLGREVARLQLGGEVAQIHQQTIGRERRKVAVLTANETDRPRAGLCLGGDAIVERSEILGDELDLALEVGEDRIPHRLGLGHLTELGREEDDFAGVLNRTLGAADAPRTASPPSAATPIPDFDQAATCCLKPA